MGSGITWDKVHQGLGGVFAAWEASQGGQARANWLRLNYNNIQTQQDN